MAAAPQRVFVQFHDDLDATNRMRMVGQYGLRLQDYVPNNAYLERVDPQLLPALRDDEAVRAVVPYRPAFKLSPLIGRVPPRTPERRDLPALAVHAGS